MSYDIGEYEYTYPATKPHKSLGTQLKEAFDTAKKKEADAEEQLVKIAFDKIKQVCLDEAQRGRETCHYSVASQLAPKLIKVLARENVFAEVASVTHQEARLRIDWSQPVPDVTTYEER